MIAGLFIISCQEMSKLVPLYTLRPASKSFEINPAAFYTEKANLMEQAVWEAGWDGEWFRRAYDAFGEPLGSHLNTEGKIFIEPQGMCVMAGLGVENGKARQALDAVEQFLATPHGLVLLNPAFTRYYLHLGEISSYPPGYKENAGIFCHANPWIMIAETAIGRGDKAFDYYKRINPSAREEISEVHRCEPYVYAQMIAGKDAPTHGEAKNSWLTGTASWNYVAITQHILGIKPTHEGLSVQPVIPVDWQGFEAKRIFRGVRYNIKVERHGSGNSAHITVDGQPIEGCVIPLPPKDTHEVNVLIHLS